MGWVGELLRGDFSGFLRYVLRFRAEQSDVGKSQILAQLVEMLARPAVFFEIGGEIGGFFAQCALGPVGFDFVAQLEKTAGAYKNLENLENMYKHIITCIKPSLRLGGSALVLPPSCQVAMHCWRSHAETPCAYLAASPAWFAEASPASAAACGEAALASMSMWAQLHVRM